MNTEIPETILDTNPFDICIILPTRGRTTALKKSLESLFSLAAQKNKIQLILAFDRDDYLGLGYFNDILKHWLGEQLINYSVLITQRFGYEKLNRYCNIMANMAQADWIFMWNDDAIMQTKSWDRQIAKYTGQFKVLSVITNNEHPYSIFPIIPQAWVKVLGRVARHQLNDTEVSQMAYLLDIFQRIPVYCVHDRADLTGNNKDTTFDERYYHEGDPNDPEDFRNPDFYKKRIQDMQRLAHYMKVVGLDTSWWESCIKGENKEPFAKLAANDPNKQVNIGTEFKK
jgi:hypothetical protein